VDNQSFQFIDNKCPHEVFKKRLRKDDYSILISFFEGRSSEEWAGMLAVENRQLDYESLKLLIKIDRKGMIEFMTKWKNANFMEKSILDDYEKCLKETKQADFRDFLFFKKINSNNI
jgi:hypothetical protein